MKRILFFIVITMNAFSMAQKSPLNNSNTWQVGFGLGEIPTGGSFKPSLTLGYYFKRQFYLGVIYQFKDEIQRNEASFNSKASNLTGLESSSEKVNQRFMLQFRYTPFRFGPYLSTGFVYNGKDTETMYFDHRQRTIDQQTAEGSIVIQQSRPAGWGFALGLGYQFDFKNGFSVGFEWTPAWFQYASPKYIFNGSADLSEETQTYITNQMNQKFKKSVTNLYKVFHFGIAYRFQSKRK